MSPGTANPSFNSAGISWTVTGSGGATVALTFLGRSGRVDSHRVLVLRTGSDFAVPPPGEMPAQALGNEADNDYAALGPAVEAAYRVGAPVVDALVHDWATYKEHPPQPRTGAPK